MNPKRRKDGRPSLRLGAGGTAMLVVWLCGGAALAQFEPPAHLRYRENMPPGEIGARQLARGGPLGGYFQPVRVDGPPGSEIEIAVGDSYEGSHSASFMAGLLIGQVYRYKVTGIPENEGLEVYPTVEVIDRLYPPPGLEARFPIPIQLTQEELELALDGNYVMRVIYLEDPATAVPAAAPPGLQPYFEVHPQQDPLEVADRLGRPMAILRMGSRVPVAGEQPGIGLGTPPMILFKQPEDVRPPRHAEGRIDPRGPAPLFPAAEPSHELFRR